MDMPLQSDRQFRVNWPNNTTPQAPDGSGTKSVSLCGVVLTNTNAAARFVKFYDKGASPSIGNDTPVRTYTLPANSTTQIDYNRGKLFVNGMWVSVTVLAADSDTTAPAAGDVLMTVEYL